ncbi:MAG: 30S ribosomal protein S12 methylthiotransferase RimO [Oscillospiraceae bacterium]|nr:30S ribosomal protein S12 methylthiotransferase RimO [Oscillospiraceae bacterium]
MPETVALISLGCAKNLINSEQMLFLLAEAGYDTTKDPTAADAVIINTCGFIEAAKTEAIDAILETAKQKAEGKVGKIIVTGCLAQRYRNEIREELPEIDSVLGVGSFAEIADALKKTLAGEKVFSFGDISAAAEDIPRAVSTGPGRAYLKIAEGCDNRCAYCAIPDIRGAYRSRDFEKILDEARTLAASGIKELMIIAQDITRYGLDLYGRRRLPELCRALCAISGVEWIRLHYLYPDDIDDDLIQTVASEPKILKYLDIPIQHINSDVLSRMNRRSDGPGIKKLFKTLRARIDGLVLRTSLIVGFPGENEEEFNELIEFLSEARIERAGVFAFSPEEGTAAFAMEDRCSPREAALRAERVTALQAEIADEYCRGLLGKTLKVICDGVGEDGVRTGRSAADSPDIDGLVFFEGEVKPGEFAEVRITGFTDGDLTGKETRPAPSGSKRGALS